MFGGEYLLKNNPYKDTKIPVAQFTAEGGYYFKILSEMCIRDRLLADKSVYHYYSDFAEKGYYNRITVTC